MDNARLRAWWSHRQGLDGSMSGQAPARVLERSGWARSVGGVGPYLTLFSRAGIDREAADRAVAALEIHELPSARGCTYVVPSCDYALALRVGEGFDEGEMKVAYKLGVTDREVDRLCDKVVQALEPGPLEPEGIREAVGGAARNLGEAGKKKGLATTLPLALGRLQTSGEIRRIPTNGRLDQQRYRYGLWRPNPLAECRLSKAEAFVELARRYFGWIGPATLDEFRWFSGLGVRAAATAVESLNLVPVEGGSDRLMLEDHRKLWRAYRPPAKPQYRLVGSLDAISALRREVESLLEPVDRARKVLDGKSLISAGGLSNLPSHAILDRGRLVGFWEYDVEGRSIVWSSFGVRDEALAGAVAETEAFVREQLGDARSFSLDSPKSRAPRIAALKKAY